MRRRTLSLDLRCLRARISATIGELLPAAMGSGPDRDANFLLLQTGRERAVLERAWRCEHSEMARCMISSVVTRLKVATEKSAVEICKSAADIFRQILALSRTPDLLLWKLASVFLWKIIAMTAQAGLLCKRYKGLI